MSESLREGDTLVAWKLDRLGRNLRHLVNLVHDLTRRGIGLKVLADEGASIDTTTPQGRLMFGFFAALAEFERELIVERTKAGLASARARGRNGGRRFKVTASKLRLAQAAMGMPETNVAALRDQFRPRSLHRRDRGTPRKAARDELERYCEIIAALKVRTTNSKGRHLSTRRALEILITHGVETPEGLVQPPAQLLTKTTVNRYLRAWGFDDARLKQPPVAVRFQAEHSNECWQFDATPSDLKQVPAPPWVEEGRGPPSLMLFSVVDDRSGVAHPEYRCVYGEDAASGLRFLFNAMAPKEEPGLVLQGILHMIYADNRLITKSRVYRDVMAQLGVDARTHMPKGSDGQRVTARSKGKSLPTGLTRGVDARVQTAGVLYKVDPDLAGETVTLWWGLFDQQLFVEHEGKRFGLFGPIGGSIPLHRYRSFKKTWTEERFDRIEALAAKLGVPRAVMDSGQIPAPARPSPELPAVLFKDPDPFHELRFPSVLAAKLAIADYLATPLARLSPQDRTYIDSVLAETLERRTIIECIRGYFRECGRASAKGDDHAV